MRRGAPTVSPGDPPCVSSLILPLALVTGLFTNCLSRCPPIVCLSLIYCPHTQPIHSIPIVLSYIPYHSVTDDDVAVLAEFLKLTVGFDFAGCSSITNKALTYLPELKLIRALSFDNCTAIDNKGLTHLLPILTDLEVLSLAGLGGITDEGLMPIFSECGRLKVVSVSNCPMVTHVALSVLVNKNKMLSTLKCSAIDISDEGNHSLSSSHPSPFFPLSPYYLPHSIHPSIHSLPSLHLSPNSIVISTHFLSPPPSFNLLHRDTRVRPNLRFLKSKEFHFLGCIILS